VPSGRTSDGIPTGIQIVARPWDDARAFRAGLAYEQALGGWFNTKAKRPVL
jgi:amidase